jgi:hypothetical protein
MTQVCLRQQPLTSQGISPDKPILTCETAVLLKDFKPLKKTKHFKAFKLTCYIPLYGEKYCQRRGEGSEITRFRVIIAIHFQC